MDLVYILVSLALTGITVIAYRHKGFYTKRVFPILVTISTSSICVGVSFYMYSERLLIISSAPSPEFIFNEVEVIRYCSSIVVLCSFLFFMFSVFLTAMPPESKET